MKKKTDTITAKEFDKLFDSGKDISAYVDYEKSTRPGLEARRVNIDIPEWMIAQLDKESLRLNVPRQSIIKFWLAEKLAAVNHAN